MFVDVSGKNDIVNIENIDLIEDRHDGTAIFYFRGGSECNLNVTDINELKKILNVTTLKKPTTSYPKKAYNQ